MTSVRPSRIAQVAIPIHDLERAKAFYGERLGLTHLFDAPPGLSFFQCGETRLMLSQPEGPETAGSSILYYAVASAREAQALLIQAGTVFEHDAQVHRPGRRQGYLARRLPRQRGQLRRPDERGVRSGRGRHPVAARREAERSGQQALFLFMENALLDRRTFLASSTALAFLGFSGLAPAAQPSRHRAPARPVATGRSAPCSTPGSARI